MFEQYLAMKPGLGWMHIKDYRHPAADAPHGPTSTKRRSKHFVPADMGDSGHEAILRDFATIAAQAGAEAASGAAFPACSSTWSRTSKGGGQFGGFSGPDGMGVALRGLCRVLDYVGIDYHLRDFDDILATRTP